jgi:hypothetical protein
MTAASSRKAARLLRDRRRTQRATARIHRNGDATLATHAIAAGLGPREARTVASSLRTATRKLGITGRPGTCFRKGARRNCTCFTPAEVAVAATSYRPRRPEYKLAAAQLRLAA